MGILSDKYRVGVVNDFSIVSKAVIHVFKANPTALTSTDKYTWEKALPVQINPNNLRFNYGMDSLSGMGGLKLSVSEPNKFINTRKTLSEGCYDNTLRVELEYDIYDEYNIRTLDGTSGGENVGLEISLLNNKITSLPDLISICKKADKYVLFRWGEIWYFGNINDVDCDYKAFSRWGEPLKASVIVSIQQQILGSSGDLNTYFTSSIGQIKSYQRASDALNRAALLASQAMR